MLLFNEILVVQNTHTGNTMKNNNNYCPHSIKCKNKCDSQNERLTATCINSSSRSHFVPTRTNLTQKIK